MCCSDRGVGESTDEAPVALVRDVTGYRADEAVREIVGEKDRDWQRKLHEAALSRPSGRKRLNSIEGKVGLEPNKKGWKAVEDGRRAISTDGGVVVWTDESEEEGTRAQ